MTKPIPDAALDQLFRDARTQNGWLPEPVPDATLQALYELVKMGPTSANQQPLRVKFLRTEAAKRRLEPLLSEGNRAKTMQAPVVAILGYDLAFYEHLPRMFPHNLSARSWFEGKPGAIQESAFRNGTLQAGYFIVAARALGLDCGPMGGIDAPGIDAAFWAGTEVKTNFVCALGRGDPSKVFGRLPRFDFAEVCELL